jgi:hypothetical protein
MRQHAVTARLCLLDVSYLLHHYPQELHEGTYLGFRSNMRIAEEYGIQA